MPDDDPHLQLLSEQIAALSRSILGQDFFHVVRTIECLHPHLPRLGASVKIEDDPLRLGQTPSLIFAPSTLHSYLPPSLHRPVGKLLVYFLGLTGPSGPLPLRLTEFIRNRQNGIFDTESPTHGSDLSKFRAPRDRALAAFLDLFHHRVLSLFYRSWAVCRQSVDLDRPSGQRYPIYVGSFFGLGMESLRHRTPVPDWAKLFFAGHLACQTRHAEGLDDILTDYFGVPVTVYNFIGQWLRLPPENQCRLGASPQTGLLGQNAIAGSKFYDCQLKFRVCMGPMSLQQAESLLPGGPSLEHLKVWLKHYVGHEFYWDLQIIIRKEDVPPLGLGKSSRLGWTTWIKTQDFTRDADDLILSIPGNDPPPF